MYLGLHHQHSLGPHLLYELINVEILPIFHPLQHGVKSDEGARPAHTGAAVHQQGRACGRMCFANTLDEVKHAGLVVRNSMVWPGCEVEVSHFQLSSIFFSRLDRNEGVRHLYRDRERERQPHD